MMNYGCGEKNTAAAFDVRSYPALFDSSARCVRLCLAADRYLEDEAKDLVGYGGKNVRHMILLAFIICDGDPSRERRHIIFDPRWRMMVRAQPTSYT
jgi:hypothetical protein